MQCLVALSSINRKKMSQYLKCYDNKYDFEKINADKMENTGKHIKRYCPALLVAMLQTSCHIPAL